MSRCFPYPPPGYSSNRASNDALIESIKLQREREKAEAERKREKKREKKEKRREKKEKAKLTSIDTPLDEQAQKLEGNYKSKNIEDNPEQLTRSGLTEEHGQPISSHKPSYSSDSTQNSNKRKRTASPINTTSNGSQFSGNTFRIRLPMRKHKEPVASASKEDPCSTSGRRDRNVQAMHEAAKETTRYSDIRSIPLVEDSVVKRLAARPNNVLGKTIGKAEILAQDKGQTAARPDIAVNKPIGKIELFAKDTRQTVTRPNNSTTKSGIFLQDGRPMAATPSNTAIGKAEIYAQDKWRTTTRPENASNSTIDKAEVLVQDKNLIASGSSSHKKQKRVCKQYVELFKTWVPPPIENVLTDSDDQEWLFGGKRQKRDEEVGDKRLNGSNCCVSYVMQPVARYLPEADIYALPYTVPF